VHLQVMLHHLLHATYLTLYHYRNPLHYTVATYTHYATVAYRLLHAEPFYLVCTLPLRLLH